MPFPLYSKAFKKDAKRQKRRGKDMQKLRDILSALIEGKELPSKNKDHDLIGNLKDCRECHIEPDWLLIYKETETEVYFTRTGSHSDLFE